MDIPKVDYGRWQLPQNLEELSNGGSFPGILREWELDYIEHLAPGEDSETCLCTHFPIREVCHIRHLENGNVAIVGNCCVKKFEKEEEGLVNFAGTHKVFDALKRLQRNENASANEELLNYAYSKRILTQAEYDVYINIWRNRTFTDQEIRLMLTANRKILNHANSEAMRAHIERQAEERRAQRQPPVQAVPARRVVTAAPPAPANLPVWRQQPVMDLTKLPSLHTPEHQTRRWNSNPEVQQLPSANHLPAPTILSRVNTISSPIPRPQQPTLSPISQRASDSAVTPVVVRKRMDQLFADLRAQPQQVADVQIVQEAFAQKILKENEHKFYMQMVQVAGKSPMSQKQQSWLSALNRNILAQLKINGPVPNVGQITPRALRLADRQIVIDGCSRGLIKEKDRDFYLELISRQAANPSQKQREWISDIHKRLRIEDEQTEANTNNRPVKRALTMEDPFEEKK